MHGAEGWKWEHAPQTQSPKLPETAGEGGPVTRLPLTEVDGVLGAIDDSLLAQIRDLPSDLLSHRLCGARAGLHAGRSDAKRCDFCARREALNQWTDRGSALTCEGPLQYLKGYIFSALDSYDPPTHEHMPKLWTLRV